jgi:RsiW-degrading membrane proteinase PrsW (M82 family)
LADRWFYAVGDERRGPVEKEELLRMIADGRLRRTTLVWTRSLADWTPAGELAELKGGAWPSPAGSEDTQPTAARMKEEVSAPSAGEILQGIGKRIANFAELSTISRVPVRQILVGGFSRATKAEDLEETFAVGGPSTTPALSDVADGWPTPRIFWRVLLGAVAAWLLLRIGVAGSGIAGYGPGFAVIGSFLVPLAVVILFFELNSPKNVSVYQVGKLWFAGAVLALVLGTALGKVLPAAGAGDLLPAFLTAVVEEAAKALVLVFVVAKPRYRWQLNGLLFGAAVGSGFAAFETAGHAVVAAAGDATLWTIHLGGWLTPAGHVIWTAIVGSAIWKVKGDKPFHFGMLLAPVVLRRSAIAVVLHGLWNTTLGPPWIKWVVLSIIGWYIVLGIVTQALDEVGAEKKAAAA